MNLCHEIGHILLGWSRSGGIGQIRCELLAWRIAKTFCKDEYWNEDEAIGCLQTYFDYHRYNHDASKLKIIPLKNNSFVKKLEDK